MTTVNFDPAKRERLREAYGVAVGNSQAEFTFEGAELVTSYARYLLQYLDRTLQPINSKKEKP